MIATDQFVLVAVRLKSRRLPRKALADICGKPLVIRLTDRLAQRIPREQIVLCTSGHPEDDPIASLAGECGLNCVRGHELDVMARFLEAAERFGARTIARVTGDNPLTDPEMLEHMFETHTAGRAEYSFTNDLPVGTRAEIIDTEALRRIHRQLVDPCSSEYMTYMLKRPDKLRIREIPVPDPRLKRPEISVTVDTLDDIRLVRSIYEHFGADLAPLVDIITWLDSVPEQRIIIPSMSISASLPEGVDCSYRDDAERN